MGITGQLQHLWEKLTGRRQEQVPFPVIFEHFQQLLADNQRAMELIADLGEKSGGEYIFDRKYLNDVTEELQNLLLRLVKSLNFIAENRYLDLYAAVDRIFNPMQAELRGRLILSEELPYVVALQDLPLDNPELTGGKASPLGEIIQRLQLPVPPGFVITTRSYRRFLEHNHLEERIHAGLEEWLNGEADERQTSRQIQYALLAGVIPHDVAREIRRQAEAAKGEVYWAVRSSAYGEDGDLSFAGLHESVLQVPASGLHRAYKQVLASLYAPEALIYRRKMGLVGEEAAMAVLCQEMIASEASGMVHTLDLSGSDADCLAIFAAPGLGKTVAEGRAAADRYLVQRDPPHHLRLADIARKDSRLEPVAGGGVVEEAVPEAQQKQAILTEATIKTLARFALALERYFKRPQEVEWALDETGQCWVLQSRGLSGPRPAVQFAKLQGEACAYPRALLRDQGTTVFAGVASGPVFRVMSRDDLDRFPAGAILVTPLAAPWLARVVPQAAGIVSEEGSVAGHLSTLAREFQVPALVGVEGATEVLKDGATITLDSHRRTVFDGEVEHLLHYETVFPDVCESCSHYRVLIQDQGAVAHAGIGCGPVFQVRSDDDLNRFPDGALLVTPYTAPWLARIVPKAAGIVSERGSVAGHLATIARELRVPALVGVEKATELLPEGLEITLDSHHRTVYEGRVTELLRYELYQTMVFEDSPEFRLLRRLLKRIAPLNLVDPQAPQFTPEGCKTVHDVIRFLHEKAVQELMDLPRFLKRVKGAQIWTLVSNVPLGLRLLDLGGGVAPETRGTKITSDQVRSLPFLALWEGVSQPGVWSTEPVAVDFKGMMSSLTKTWADTPGMTYTGFNLAVVSDTYLNLHLRLGYHFNLVDARMDPNPIHNHIYFRFVGGVTDLTRRSRRAQMLAQILSKYHFKVDTKGDLVVARVLHLPREEIGRRLQVIGRLIGFTRQLDIQLRSDEDVGQFAETFLREQAPPGEAA